MRGSCDERDLNVTFGLDMVGDICLIFQLSDQQHFHLFLIFFMKRYTLSVINAIEYVSYEQLFVMCLEGMRLNYDLRFVHLLIYLVWVAALYL